MHKCKAPVLQVYELWPYHAHGLISDGGGAGIRHVVAGICARGELLGWYTLYSVGGAP
jgi:hypothetical protein